MKRNARNAYTAISRLNTNEVNNVHLIDHGDREQQWGAHFMIGCEPRYIGDLPVGDYYKEYFRDYIDENGHVQNAYGIRTIIHDTLSKYNLYAEWINPALIGVYDV